MGDNTEHVTPNNLVVGDIIQIAQLDEDTPTGKWEKVLVTNISVCHHYRPVGILDPYIGVNIDWSSVKFFNYSLYCQNGWVKGQYDET